jgi:hypothetical protein
MLSLLQKDNQEGITKSNEGALIYLHNSHNVMQQDTLLPSEFPKIVSEAAECHSCKSTSF